jgi:exodeoxyribonuclease-3
MKIATYNVNGVNGRLPVLIKWLKTAKPDIVCLQELKAPDEKFPEEQLKALGYSAIWHGQKSWNGVAILTKAAYPVEAIYKGLPGDPEDVQSRYIEAKINGIIIACLYLPNGNPAPGPKFDYKMTWYKRLLTKARRLIKKGVPVVLVGDYNTVPTELDAHKPERWVNDAVFFPEPRAAFQKLLQQGWIDAIRVLYPGEKIFTYWDYFANAFNRNAGIRMDHFLLSPDLQERLVAGDIDKQVRAWEKTSDHAPVWIEIRD